MTRFAALFLLSAGAAITMQAPAFAQTEIKITTFSGATNVVTWVAIEKGFFEKEGLKATAERTEGSKQQMADLMAGKYQFASSSFDNIVAYTEGEGDVKYPDYDVVAILGVHQGLTSVVSRPEITDYKQLKGKTAAVDSANSGYATVLFQIIKNKAHLVQGKDYQLAVVGGTRQRVEALESNTAQVGIVSAPNDEQLEAKGYHRLGDVSQELGAYQGSTFVVRRSYAKANPKVVEAFTRAIIAASDYVFANKAGTIEVMKRNLKKMTDAEAESTYKRLIGPGGLSKHAQISIKGVETVLKLRSIYGEKKGPAPDPKKYVDVSYYQKAMKK